MSLYNTLQEWGYNTLQGVCGALSKVLSVLNFVGLMAAVSYTRTLCVVC